LSRHDGNALRHRPLAFWSLMPSLDSKVDDAIIVVMQNAPVAIDR
jgi:hypothetical protein